MSEGSPSLKLVHSVAEPEIATCEGSQKKARLGIVRNELSFILGRSTDATLAEISRMTPIARELVKEAVLEHFMDQQAADSVEHIPDMEHSTLESGQLKLCFGFIHEGRRRVIGAEVDSKYRIGYFLSGEDSDEAAFSLFDPEEE